ncbi:MAG: hypothetical protein H6Q08_3062 [Acidobacteria bacterium]|nr:hypothetical protein [Acidobacteriota bacterium]
MIDPRAQRDAVACRLGNQQPVVHGVGRAWRDEPNVGDRTRGPGIPLVDGVAAFVEHEAPIKVRGRVDRPAPPVLDESAVQEHLALVVHGLQLDPHVECVDGPPGKEVPDVARSHHHVDTNRLASSHDGIDAIERRDDLARGLEHAARGPEARRLLAHGERARQLGFPSRTRAGLLCSSRAPDQREDVHRYLPAPQKVLRALQLLIVTVHVGQRRVGGDEAVRPDPSVPGCRIGGRDERHVTVQALHGCGWIVERSRPLARHTRRLPVVVVVEAANPPVAVHGHVEVHLVARGAEVGQLLAVKRLEERLAVGPR